LHKHYQTELNNQSLAFKRLQQQQQQKNIPSPPKTPTNVKTLQKKMKALRRNYQELSCQTRRDVETIQNKLTQENSLARKYLEIMNEQLTRANTEITQLKRQLASRDTTSTAIKKLQQKIKALRRSYRELSTRTRLDIQGIQKKLLQDNCFVKKRLEQYYNDEVSSKLTNANMEISQLKRQLESRKQCQENDSVLHKDVLAEDDEQDLLNRTHQLLELRKQYQVNDNENLSLLHKDVLAEDDEQIVLKHTHQSPNATAVKESWELRKQYQVNHNEKSLLLHEDVLAEDDERIALKDTHQLPNATAVKESLELRKQYQVNNNEKLSLLHKDVLTEDDLRRIWMGGKQQLPKYNGKPSLLDEDVLTGDDEQIALEHTHQLPNATAVKESLGFRKQYQVNGNEKPSLLHKGRLTEDDLRRIWLGGKQQLPKTTSSVKESSESRKRCQANDNERPSLLYKDRLTEDDLRQIWLGGKQQLSKRKVKKQKKCQVTDDEMPLLLHKDVLTEDDLRRIWLGANSYCQREDE
jgi:hypothetical protein